LRSYLWSQRPTPATIHDVSRKVEQLCRWQGRQRFAAKLTGPGRIGYLRAIFPDARFVHLVRDCSSQVYSTINVGFWKAGGGLEQLWWDKDIPPNMAGYLQAAEATRDPVALAAAQWRSVVESIRAEAGEFLGADEYREVTYEAFVKDPAVCILNLWDWLGLETDSRATARVQSFPVRKDANEQSRQTFSAEQRATLTCWAKGTVAPGGE